MNAEGKDLSKASDFYAAEIIDRAKHILHKSDLPGGTKPFNASLQAACDALESVSPVSMIPNSNNTRGMMVHYGPILPQGNIVFALGIGDPATMLGDDCMKDYGGPDALDLRPLGLVFGGAFDEADMSAALQDADHILEQMGVFDPAQSLTQNAYHLATVATLLQATRSENRDKLMGVMAALTALCIKKVRAEGFGESLERYRTSGIIPVVSFMQTSDNRWVTLAPLPLFTAAPPALLEAASAA